MNVLPIPDGLQSVCDAIAHWAAGQRFVVKVYGYGSRVKGTHRPDSDLDIAVAILGDEGEILGTFIDERKRWEARLSELTGLRVDLNPAHPFADNVWSYLMDGSALIFERP